MLISFGPALLFAAQAPAPLPRRGLAKELSKRAPATEARTWRNYGGAAADLRFWLQVMLTSPMLP